MSLYPRQYSVAKRKPDPLVAALRERRRALGLTQKDLARAIRSQQRTVSNWETGRFQPTLPGLLAYAAAVEARIEMVELTPRPIPTREVDEVAVARVCAGEPIPLNRAEQRAAIARMTRQGLSAREIGERLGLTKRAVEHQRARLRRAA